MNFTDMKQEKTTQIHHYANLASRETSRQTPAAVSLRTIHSQNPPVSHDLNFRAQVVVTQLETSSFFSLLKQLLLCSYDCYQRVSSVNRKLLYLSKSLPSGTDLTSCQVIQVQQPTQLWDATSRKVQQEVMQASSACLRSQNALCWYQFVMIKLAFGIYGKGWKQSLQNNKKHMQQELLVLKQIGSHTDSSARVKQQSRSKPLQHTWAFFSSGLKCHSFCISVLHCSSSSLQRCQMQWNMLQSTSAANLC